MVDKRIATIVAVCLISTYADVLTRKSPIRVPDDFEFGAATAAYQIEGAWNVDGSAAENAAKLKHTKYSALEPMYDFVPVAVETAGPWGSEAQDLFEELGRRLRDRGCDHRSESWLVQQVSIAVQRGNAASIMGTFEPDTIRGGIFLGKGRSIWDHFVHTQPELITDGTNADIAANSYYFFKRDVEMLKELGVNNYRFSISWPRIMPFGRPDYINSLGIEYYNNVIDELLANDITPFVTMYHWDLPQSLQEQGGWLNEEIVDWFGDYARVLYENFGDRVKHWLTLNEPYIHCYFSYGIGYHPPLHYSPGEDYYECGRHYLLANARAYHIYDDEFRASQGGLVGFIISMEWGMPATGSADDVQASRDYAAFHNDHFMHPIFSEQGNYPQIMIDRVAAASARQGLNVSRLRPFSNEQIQYLKGSADFLGLNHYFSTYVYRNSSLEGSFTVPSLEDDIMVGKFKDPSWPHFGMTHEYGPGLYYLLNFLKEKYNNPLIYITENGASTLTGLEDDSRVSYIRNYLSSVMKAVNEGVNVKGYFIWSLMDNFEWARGYWLRFGIYEVDMNDTNKKRTPRKSALVYKEIIRSRLIDFSYEPDPYAKEIVVPKDVAACSVPYFAIFALTLFVCLV